MCPYRGVFRELNFTRRSIMMKLKNMFLAAALFAVAGVNAQGTLDAARSASEVKGKEAVVYINNPGTYVGSATFVPSLTIGDNESIWPIGRVELKADKNNPGVFYVDAYTPSGIKLYVGSIALKK
jgi:hypothetical protein